ncbi:hypothetical protein CASFOL_031751 [Castilleja foliolosa]|uniref:Uncharacterized protein n=1 Tax=Castilleja foliolosa TaxID=1961234 RepID=A0ABD3C6E8_9LAMI
MYDKAHLRHELDEKGIGKLVIVRSTSSSPFVPNLPPIRVHTD